MKWIKLKAYREAEATEYYTRKEVYRSWAWKQLIMMNLFAFPSTHERRLCALVVDIAPEIVHVWLR